MSGLQPSDSSHNPQAQLASLVQSTGSRERATQLLRETTMALAERESPQDVVVQVDAVEVLGAAAADVPNEILPIDAVEVLGAVVEVPSYAVVHVPQLETAHAVTQIGRKRKAKGMTAAEAIAQAALEGLQFITSSTSASGYSYVNHDKRSKTGRPFSAYVPGAMKKPGSCLGCFATAEEAALEVARHMGNTSERVARVGNTTLGKESTSYVAVCKAPSCGALVQIVCAIRAARADGRTCSFAVGDGCAKCGDKRNSAKVKDTQIKTAKALLTGERTLITWPSAPGTAARKGKTNGFEKEARELRVGDAEMRATAEGVLESWQP